MKKLIALFMVLSVFASLAGCTTKNTDEKNRTGERTFDYDTINKNVGELIYTNNNQSVPMFPTQTRANLGDIKEIYGIDTDLLEDFYISSSGGANDPGTYMILKPKEGKADEVKKQANAYFDLYMTSWATGSSQYNMVKNRLQNEYNGYLIYVVSKDNQLVYDTIINSR